MNKLNINFHKILHWLKRFQSIMEIYINPPFWMTQHQKKKKVNWLTIVKKTHICMKMTSVNFHQGSYKMSFRTERQTDSVDRDQTAQSVQSDLHNPITFRNHFSQKRNFEIAYIQIFTT